MDEPQGASNEGEPEPSSEELALVRSDEPEPALARPVNRPSPPDLRDRGGADLQRKVTYLPDTHRLLPQSPDAERGVLSSFLLAPREVGGMCAEKRVTPDHFFIPSHMLIFKTLMGLWEGNQPIDFITLTQYLRNAGKLDESGGAAFVTELFTFLPTAANCAYYLEILLEKWTLREIIKTGTEYAARAYDEQDDVPELLGGFEQKTLAISNIGSVSKIVGMKQGVVEAIGYIEELYSRRGEIGGISTGFADLDKLTDGLHGGEMIVIAARPSQGKTALAMNMAEHMAVNLGLTIGVFSLEMSRQQLIQRLLCSMARVDLTRVREGFLSERDFPALQTAASKLAEARIYIDDSSDLTIQEIRAKARRLVNQYKCQALFVDYLQLLKSLSKQAQNNREREVSDISGGLKAMSKELGIPIVVLAQLSRNFEQRGVNARPRLSDLRESGAIEQDADTVAFLVRPETNSDLTPEEKKEVEGKAELIIAKQRHGPVGDVFLTFLKEFTRFETRAREHHGDDEPDEGPALPM